MSEYSLIIFYYIHIFIYNFAIINSVAYIPMHLYRHNYTYINRAVVNDKETGQSMRRYYSFSLFNTDLNLNFIFSRLQLSPKRIQDLSNLSLS